MLRKPLTKHLGRGPRLFRGLQGPHLSRPFASAQGDMRSIAPECALDSISALLDLGRAFSDSGCAEGRSPCAGSVRVSLTEYSCFLLSLWGGEPRTPTPPGGPGPGPELQCDQRKVAGQPPSHWHRVLVLRGGSRHAAGGRKVRAPHGRMPANGGAGRPDGKCHRNTPSATGG